MNKLAIETSSALLSVACERSDGSILELNMEGGLHHAENLMVLVERALKKQRVPKEKLDELVCGVGPGSFTGLRIGIAAMKGLASGLDKQVVRVSSLDAVAEGVPSKFGEKLVVLLDARREKLYVACYEFRNGWFQKTFRDSLLSLEELEEKINSKTVFCGYGLQIYGNEIKKRFSKPVLLKEEFWKPRASFVLSRLKRKGADVKVVSPKDLGPVYLRLSEAEERRKQIA